MAKKTEQEKPPYPYTPEDFPDHEFTEEEAGDFKRRWGNRHRPSFSPRQVALHTCNARDTEDQYWVYAMEVAQEKSHYRIQENWDIICDMCWFEMNPARHAIWRDLVMLCDEHFGEYLTYFQLLLTERGEIITLKYARSLVKQQKPIRIQRKLQKPMSKRERDAWRERREAAEHERQWEKRNL